MTNEKVGPLKYKGGKLHLVSEDVGEILSEYLASVFTKEIMATMISSCTLIHMDADWTLVSFIVTSVFML